MTECFECGQPAHHQHHVVPRSKGGTRTVPLCVECHGKAHGRAMAHPELTSAALHKRKAGGKRIGSIPHGYWLGADNVLVPDDIGQLAKQCAKQMRGAGATLREIARHLHECGILNKDGRAWNPGSIWNMTA